jgi:chemotaxis protein methyltransferase CheR
VSAAFGRVGEARVGEAPAGEAPRQGWATAILGDAEFRRLGAFIQQYCGIRCPPAKRSMVETRLRRRLRALNLDSFSAYSELVLGPRADPGELEHMIDVITTNKTDFFREGQHFLHLVAQTLPALTNERDATDRRPLAFWSAACSTGEEVYTLAMVLEESSDRRRGRPYTILGSDISTTVLSRARQAIYPEHLVTSVPMAMRQRYLLQSRDRTQGLVRVVPALRGKVRFRRANLLVDGDLPLETFDVIFCRNVLIYFDRVTQAAVLRRLTRRLSPGGYLFLGHADSITGLEVPLRPTAHTIYQKAFDPEGR